MGCFRIPPAMWSSSGVDSMKGHCPTSELRNGIVVVLALGVLFGWDGIHGVIDRLRRECSREGIRVTYFRGTNFEQRVCTRSERSVDRDYGGARPAWCVSRKRYSARWEGDLAVPTNATYTFFLQSDDGSRLFVDGDLVIDHWGKHGAEVTACGQRPLTGGMHALRVEHYNTRGPAKVRLRWKGGPIENPTAVSVPYLRKTR